MSTTNPSSQPEAFSFKPQQNIIEELEKIGIDFSDSKENVLAEVSEAVKTQSQISATAILKQYGKYLSEEQEQAFLTLASEPIILTEIDMPKPDAFIDLLNAQEEGKPIDVEKAIIDINTRPQRGHAPAATLWSGHDDEGNYFCYAFYNQDDYLRAQEGELDQSPQSWLQEKTTEELMHSLDKSDSQHPYTMEEFKEWKIELEILREGAAKSLMQRALPKDIRTTLSFDAYTQRNVRIYEELGNMFGNENLRKLYFTGEFPEGITRADFLQQIRFYNQQYKSQKKHY